MGKVFRQFYELHFQVKWVSEEVVKEGRIHLSVR